MTRSRAPLQIALIEDHAGTRAELTEALSHCPARVHLVQAFPDAESFLRAPVLPEIDVALVDLGLPRMSGAQLIHRLLAAAPRLRAVALTAFDDEEKVLDALCSGAYGYLIKDEPIERIIAAIEEAHAGEHPVSSRVVGFLIACAQNAPPPIALTFREQELANLLAEGLTYAECAGRMDVTVGTVQTHVKNLYRKLEVSSRAEVRDWVRRYKPPR